MKLITSLRNSLTRQPQALSVAQPVQTPTATEPTFQVKEIPAITMDKLTAILTAVLKDATDVASLFVHNPKSQAIEAIVVASVDVLVPLVQAVKDQIAGAAATPATPAAK